LILRNILRNRGATAQSRGHSRETALVQAIFPAYVPKIMAKPTPLNSGRRKDSVGSKLLRRGWLDGRSVEGRFLAAVRKIALKRLGHEPTDWQKQLIKDLAEMRLAQTIYARKMPDLDMRSYSALMTNIARCEKLLYDPASKPELPPGPTLEQYLRAKEEAEA
jgi:hypothetical protein